MTRLSLRGERQAWAACFALVSLASAPVAFGQTEQTAKPLAAETTPEPVSKALLFGAAYGTVPTAPAPGHSVGMVFLPGRGLITFDATGKTGAALIEAETEAIGLADARAVQAEIDARNAQMVAQEAAAAEEADQRELSLQSSGRRSLAGFNVAAASGSRSLAGGVVPLNRNAWKAEAARALGIRDGGALKNRSRLYMFGAVSGRGVGMNLLHDTDGGWRNGGLTSDQGGFIGQRQTGLAWRKGTAQASLSLIDQKTRAQVLGITAMRDKRLMLSFSITPSVKPPIAPPLGN